MYSQSVKMHCTGRCTGRRHTTFHLVTDYRLTTAPVSPTDYLLKHCSLLNPELWLCPPGHLGDRLLQKVSCHLLFVPQFMSPGHLTGSLFIIIDSWLHNTDQKGYTGHRNFPYKSHDVKTHHRPSTASVKVWLGDNYCIRMQFTLIISKSLQTLKSA